MRDVQPLRLWEGFVYSLTFTTVSCVCVCYWCVCITDVCVCVLLVCVYHGCVCVCVLLVCVCVCDDVPVLGSSRWGVRQVFI